jgi:hypothetical protein
LFKLRESGQTLSYNMPGHTWDYVANKFTSLINSL